MENEDLSSPVAASDAPVAAPVVANAPPPAPTFDPRRRIRELLAIPERDRTDAEWDELNELEIQTAPGNRIGNQPPASYGGGGKPPFHAKHRMKGKAKGKSGQGGNRPVGGGKSQHPPRKPRPA